MTARKAAVKAAPAAGYVLPKGKALMLRTCRPDGGSHHDPRFIWPKSGEVSAPDWKPTKECGYGLHGALWGEGNGGLFRWEEDSAWLVVEVDAASVVDLNGKVKVPRGNVVHFGDRSSATGFLAPFAAGRAVIGGTATAGDSGTATAGDSGTATAGDRGTATAGYRGTATAGDSGTATAGGSGTATAGYRGTATAGDSGTATAGDRGTATAGDSGTATAGDSGTATAGDSGTATAGEDGCICIHWYDHQRHTYRVTFGYIGEDGLQAGIAYRLDADHHFVPAPVQP